MGYCVFQIICNLSVSLLLLSFSVNGTTNGSEPGCIRRLKVVRNTEFKARVMTGLTINCTVFQPGCHRRPRILWCKLYGNTCNALIHSDYIKTEWKNINENEGIYFLTFLNISMEDNGSYRCKENEMSVSHSINVSVTLDDKEVSHNQSKSIDQDTLQNDDQQWLWPYVYICGGIAGLVFLVMAATLLFIRHQDDSVKFSIGKKSTRKEMANKKQYIETQSDLPPPPPPPHNNTRPSSDQSTSALYHGCENPPFKGKSSAGRVSDGKCNTVRTERGEEENALVYASLNHQVMSRGPRRAARQEPEPSEYAAIRFR